VANTLKLAARLRYLRNSEAMFAVVALPLFIWYWLSNTSEISLLIRVPPLVIVCYILAQGATYWTLKYRQFVNNAPLPLWLPRLFGFFKTSNVVGLAVVAIWLALGSNQGTAGVDLAWGVGLWAFALLEHINYYHVQLMYDTRRALNRLNRTRRLRPAMLANDMRRKV
jgi:hypothetical protein